MVALHRHLESRRTDGKTTTAVNLAASLAHDRHHTTLLVDCDLKRPSIADIFGIEPAYGVDDVLRGDARVDQCLHHPRASSAWW